MKNKCCEMCTVNLCTNIIIVNSVVKTEEVCEANKPIHEPEYSYEYESGEVKFFRIINKKLDVDTVIHGENVHHAKMVAIECEEKNGTIRRWPDTKKYYDIINAYQITKVPDNINKFQCSENIKKCDLISDKQKETVLPIRYDFYSNEAAKLLDTKEDTDYFNIRDTGNIWVCEHHKKELQAVELLQAIFIWAFNVDKNCIYINIYSTYQSYGGPEEGGWWYNCGNLIDHRCVSTCFYTGQEDEVQDGYDEDGYPNFVSPHARTLHFAEVLEKHFPNLSNIYSTFEMMQNKYYERDRKKKNHYTPEQKFEVLLDCKKLEHFPQITPHYC